MKAIYMKPDVRMYTIHVSHSILTGSFGVDSDTPASKNADNTYGLGRQGGDFWDDEEE